MSFLKDKCHFETLRIGKRLTSRPFSCGDEDLDGFFHSDFLPFEEELMGKSYCYITNDEPREIAVAFTVSNASIHNRLLTSSAKKHLGERISEEKRNINFPAVLIGRLGVNVEMQGKNIGTEVMDNLKIWFTDPDNKTGCRYLLVDAYNNPTTLNYYKRNGFEFLFGNIESEKKYRRLENIDGELHTRLMYYDLILAKVEE